MPGDLANDVAPGPLRKAGFTGYMVTICDQVLVDMIYESRDGVGLRTQGAVGVVDVDELLKKSASGGTKGKSRFDFLGANFDILCDPATITSERRFGYTVSPPLFVTGIGYLKLTTESLPKKACMEAPGTIPLIGLVGGTTAGWEGIHALIERRELRRYEKGLWNFLNHQPKWEKCADESKSDVDFVTEYSTHEEAAKAFCDKKFNLYVGDLETIVSNAAAAKAGCDFEVGARDLTNDRYAVFGKLRATGEGHSEREAIFHQFFERLTQKVVYYPSLLDRAFRHTFGEADYDQKMKVFLWSIRGDEQNSSGRAKGSTSR